MPENTSDTPETKSRSKGPMTWSLAALAVVGWAAAGWVWVSGSSERNDLATQLEDTRSVQSDLQTRLSQQIETSGAFEEVTASLREAEARLEIVTGEITTAESELADAQGRLENATTERDAAAAETEQLQAQAEPLEATLATFEKDATEAEKRIAESRQTLTDIGARIEEARGREAELQASVAELSEEVARVSEEAAGAAAEAQEAREAEARMLEQLRAAQETERLEEERGYLEQNVTALISRRDSLSETARSLADQREQLEAIVTDLSEKVSARQERIEEIATVVATSDQRAGDETEEAAADAEGMAIDGSGKPVVAEIHAGNVDAGLDTEAAATGGTDGQPAADAAVEDGQSEIADPGVQSTNVKITANDGSDAAPPVNGAETEAVEAADGASEGAEPVPLAAIEPGVYKAEIFMVTFSDDGEFNIIDTVKNRQVHGDYALDADGILTFNKDQGDEGMGSYPMACPVSAERNGIRVGDDGSKCDLLSGLVLVTEE